MEVFNGDICVTGTEAIAVIPKGTFWSLINRNKISNINGKASYGNPALYPVDGFPQKYRILLYEAFPELSDEENRREMIEEQNAILRNILPDPNARRFFAEYLKVNGDALKPEEQKKYVNSAMILNAIRYVYERSYSRHAAAGKACKFREIEFWKRQSGIMPAVSEQYVNSLPWDYRRLQDKYRNYKGNNYASLLTSKIGNQNRTKKQRAMIDRIVLSIYANEAKLFKKDVTRIYNEFILGQREIYVEGTGEVFNRYDFYHNGEPETISDGLVFNIIENPLNRKIVDKIRNDFHYNQQHHNVAMQRKSPDFSLSKISADDRDLVRRCIITDKHGNKKLAPVHAYYIYDVASGCIIGVAHSLKKDVNLREWDLATPIEIEVENHLIKGTEIEQKLLNTFTYVTVCAPMNSREKRAEQLNKAKKYYGEYAEFKVGMAKGRHYAKHEAYLSHREKIFDETNNCYKEQLEARDYESVVKEDLAQIKLYNNARHSALKDKKTKELKYDGMSRMQVLQMRQNTQAGLLNWRLLCKEWGIVRETSLKQGATFTVDYREWWLSDASIIKRFNPHNTGALAYFIPDNNGKVNEIYVYQGDRFIDCPRDLGTFQEAIAERTDEDIRIMNRQLGYKSSQKKLGKDAAQELLLGKIGSMKTETVNAVITADYESEITNYEQAEQVSELVEDYGGWVSEDWAAKALNSI